MKRFLLSPCTLAITFLVLGLASGYLIGFHHGNPTGASGSYSRLLTSSEVHELLSHKVHAQNHTINAPSGGNLVR